MSNLLATLKRLRAELETAAKSLESLAQSDEIFDGHKATLQTAAGTCLGSAAKLRKRILELEMDEILD
jgi:hypothetical protein